MIFSVSPPSLALAHQKTAREGGHGPTVKRTIETRGRKVDHPSAWIYDVTNCGILNVPAFAKAGERVHVQDVCQRGVLKIEEAVRGAFGGGSVFGGVSEEGKSVLVA